MQGEEVKTPDKPAPLLPPTMSRETSMSRLPTGVSGWIDLSARHKMLGLFGPMVLQRRFFEIDWEKRRITYYNESTKDGEFHRGHGKEKHIPMASIVRIVHPSRRLGLGFSRPRRAAAFDIETPDRSFTLVPLIPGPPKQTPALDLGSLPEPIVTVEDFRVCIADSNFSSRDAPTQLGRLLLKREITDSGTPWEFECPLTLDIMEDPVIASDGATYERKAIEDWFSRVEGSSLLSPSTQQPMPNRTLTPHYRLREEISAFTKAKNLLRKEDPMAWPKSPY